MKNDKGISPTLLLLGIFLISASGLMLEVTLTRIFSATIWYHYAFVAISVALFGWGLGGFFLHILKENQVILERHKKPVAVMLNYEQFERFRAMLDFAEDYILGSIALERDHSAKKSDFIDLDRW